MNPEFLAALAQIEEEKGIPHGVLMEAVKASIESAYRKRYGATGELRVDFGEKNTGPLRIVALRQVVDRMENPQGSPWRRRMDPRPWWATSSNRGYAPDFGRIAAQTAKQVIVQRVREAERRSSSTVSRAASRGYHRRGPEA